MSGNEIGSYCREIETYLCRKNDGHLIRVAGPSFDLVSQWAADGVPLKVAFRGIDRYFERYYRKGPRRRPVKIDFCEADVRDAFDDWRRAVGVVSRESRVDGPEPGVEGLESGAASPESGVESRQSRAAVRRGPSLPEHLERVLLKLTAARAGGRIGPAFDDLLDRVARELDGVRAEARGVRGDARRAIVDRLAILDRELVTLARHTLTASDEAALVQEAEDELSGFRTTMNDLAFAGAREAIVDRLVRERFDLPLLAYRT